MQAALGKETAFPLNYLLPQIARKDVRQKLASATGSQVLWETEKLSEYYWTLFRDWLLSGWGRRMHSCCLSLPADCCLPC